MLNFIETINITYRFPGIFLLLGAVATFFICRWYLKQERQILSTAEYSIIFTNRFLIIILFILMIFNPLIVWHHTIVESEKELLLIDNSRSVALSDSGYTGKIKILLKKIAADTELNNRVITCLFGDSIRLISSDSMFNATDRSTAFPDLIRSEEKTGLPSKDLISGATVITDGRFNRGENPLNLKFPFPINCVAAGLIDQSVDLALINAEYQEHLTSSDRNRWTVTAGYDNPLKTLNADIMITRNGREIYRIAISIPAGKGELKVECDLPVPEKKLDEINVAISSATKEQNEFNNRLFFYQKQPESRDKVLLASDAPTLDAFFLSGMLKNAGLPVERLNWKDIRNLPAGQMYKSIIVLDLPENYSAEELNRLQNSSNGILFFANANTSRASLNELLKISLSSGRNQTTGHVEDNRNVGSDFLYSTAAGAVTLKGLPEIDFITDLRLPSDRFIPILNRVFQEKSLPTGWISADEREKVAVLNLENFWKMLFEVHNQGKNDNFRYFMLNLLDYLSIEGGAQRLTVNVDKTVYEAGEQILISGRYYDKNYQPLFNRKIRFKLKNRAEEIVLSAGKENYQGTLVVTQPGYYEYRAEVVDEDRTTYLREGSFKVVQNSLENRNITPDPEMLNSLAAKNHGSMIQSDSLIDWLKRKPAVTHKKEMPSSYQITNQLWYLLLLILLLTIEWIWRKIRT